MIALTPQLPAHSRALRQEKQLAFELLHDPGNRVAEAFGLRWTVPEDLKQLYLKFGVDLAASNGDDSWTLPIPARYLIDGDGIVRDLQFDPDYTRRPDPAETIARLEQLQQR